MFENYLFFLFGALIDPVLYMVPILQEHFISRDSSKVVSIEADAGVPVSWLIGISFV